MADVELERSSATAAIDSESSARGSRLVVGTLALLLGMIVAAGLGAAGYALAGGGSLGGDAAAGEHRREFMFEVLGVTTPNQGGQRLNLFFHYRYIWGLAEGEIPDYRKLRTAALEFLRTADLSKTPYWETLNHELCGRLKTGYPVEAISCQMQVAGNEDPDHYEPGYHSSVETIGDIASLRVPGPQVTS